jgi:hypothetical protein
MDDPTAVRMETLTFTSTTKARVRVAFEQTATKGFVASTTVELEGDLDDELLQRVRKEAVALRDWAAGECMAINEAMVNVKLARELEDSLKAKKDKAK